MGVHRLKEEGQHELEAAEAGHKVGGDELQGAGEGGEGQQAGHSEPWTKVINPLPLSMQRNNNKFIYSVKVGNGRNDKYDHIERLIHCQRLPIIISSAYTKVYLRPGVQINDDDVVMMIVMRTFASPGVSYILSLLLHGL